MKGCFENLIGWSIVLVVIGFAAAPFVIAAAAAALPFVVIGALFWFFIAILRSQGLSDYLAAQRRKARAVRNPPSSYTDGFANVPLVSPPPPASSSTAPRSQTGAGRGANGRPFRVYDAFDARPQRTVLYAEEYDDGRIKGYAVYIHRDSGMRIVPRSEFDRRYRRWTT